MRIAALAAIMVVGAAVAIVAARSVHGMPAPPAPVLIYRVQTTDAEPPASAREDDRALSLAVASLSTAERERIVELVNYTTARLETRLSPLGTDLGDEDDEPVAQLKKDTARYTPALTAARAFERGHWSASDMRVRMAATCMDLDPGEQCAPAFRAGSDDTRERRARFLAWAVTSSAVIELASAEMRDVAARLLRKRVATPDTAIALVLDVGALAFAPVPEQPTLRAAARQLGRALAANELKEHSHLESLARATPTGRSAPWLELPPNALLVVPRLSAALNHAQLRAEIEATLPHETCRWLIRPGE